VPALGKSRPGAAARGRLVTVAAETTEHHDGLGVVYTDGACIKNPGRGGWAWAVGEDRFESGFEPETTNQRMELTAALEALQALAGPWLVVSDSTYLVNCFRDRWYRGWRLKGWRTSRGEPVANQDLWRPLVELVVEGNRQIEFKWVKGHSSDQMNLFVDHLANDAARSQRASVGGDMPSLGDRIPASNWEQGRLLP
jgi:ribonuclease HI